jgi:hypothetical protein
MAHGHSQHVSLQITDFKTWLLGLAKRLWRRNVSFRAMRNGGKLPLAKITRLELALLRGIVVRNDLPCVLRWKGGGLPELTVYLVSDHGVAEPALTLIPQHLTSSFSIMRDRRAHAERVFRDIALTESNRNNLLKYGLIQPSRHSSIPPSRP